jgi:hypothetical protein
MAGETSQFDINRVNMKMRGKIWLQSCPVPRLACTSADDNGKIKSEQVIF